MLFYPAVTRRHGVGRQILSAGNVGIVSPLMITMLIVAATLSSGGIFLEAGSINLNAVLYLRRATAPMCAPVSLP